MKPTQAPARPETIEHDERPVHQWRMAQLARLGIPRPLDDAVADHVDWDEIAAPCSVAAPRAWPCASSADAARGQGDCPRNDYAPGRRAAAESRTVSRPHPPAPASPTRYCAARAVLARSAGRARPIAPERRPRPWRAAQPGGGDPNRSGSRRIARRPTTLAKAEPEPSPPPPPR